MSGQLHIYINEIGKGSIFLKRIPCFDCSASVKPDESANELFELPILHSIQHGVCHQCGAVYFVANGRTKADCVALEPVLARMQAISDMHGV